MAAFLLHIRKHPAPWIVSLLAFLLFASISIINHYHFRTYSFDLGLFNQAMYDYRNFRFSDTGTFRPFDDNFLADHFDLYLMVFSPLSWILGSSTLLWIQVFFLILGSWGVYRYFENDAKSMALPAMITFLTFYGVYTALAFDYHSNVVAASCVPWFLLNIKKQRYLPALLWLLWILSGKETMSLWMGVISVCLLWEYRNHNQTLKWLGIFWAVCIFWFVSINLFVLPALNSTAGYAHFKYQILGDNPLDALKTLITKPHIAFKDFIHNHNQSPDGHGIKEESIRLLLISGSWILLFRPAYLLMLTPVVFMKFFHDEAKTWSICYHYSIEFTPIMAIGIFNVLSSLKNKFLRISASWLTVGGTSLATVISMLYPHFYCGGERHQIFTKEHWTCPNDLDALHEGLAKVPKNARISANSALVPRLAFRDRIYCYPLLKDAEYVVFCLGLPPYPLSWEDNVEHCTRFYHDPDWELFFVNKEVRIFKRIHWD